MRMVYVLGTCVLGFAAAHAEDHLMVFAAVSLEPAMAEILRDWRAADGTTARGNYAASSQLARQIEEGAMADVFMSADERWMDELAHKSLLKTTSRVDLLGNHLVLIAPVAQNLQITVTHDFAIADAFTGRLATTDPAVPLGHYAQETFDKLGWTTALQDRLLPTQDANSALRLVERGEVTLGVAYSSDATGDALVKVVGDVPDSLHTPIRYPVSLLVSAKPAASQLLERLRSPTAAEIFARHGFVILKPAPAP